MKKFSFIHSTISNHCPQCPKVNFISEFLITSPEGTKKAKKKLIRKKSASFRLIEDELYSLGKMAKMNVDQGEVPTRKNRGEIL